MAIDDLEQFPIAGFDPNPSDLTDRLNQTTSRRKNVLTPDEYQKSFVDFYSQTLGNTGIDVGDDDDEEEEEEEEQRPKILYDEGGGDDNYVSYTSMGEGFKEPDVQSVNFDNIVGTSYKDLLAKDNVKDIVDFDSFGITLSRPSKSTLKKSGTVIGLASVVAPSLGVFGTDLVGSIFGDERTEIDGKTGFRPAGGLGLAYDLNNSIQAANFNAGKLARQENMLENESADIAGTTPNLKPEGFFARIDGQLVSRKPGSINYDGVYNYTPEQLKSMEALRKGFNPSGFNLRTEMGSETITNTSATRGYTERGTFVSINGTAAAGSMKDLDGLRTTANQRYGVTFTEQQVRDALKSARDAHSIFSRSTKKGSGLNDFLSRTANQIKQEQRDREEAQRKAEADERARKAVEQNRRDREAREQRERERQQRENEQRARDEQAARDARDAENRRAADRARAEAERRRQEEQRNDSGNGGDDGGTSEGAGGAEGSVGDGYGGGDRFGGRISKREGDVVKKPEVTQPAGFIAPDANATDQQEIADDIPFDGEDGAFVINAPAAEDAGKQDIQRMINVAITNLQEKGVDVRFGNPKINIADKVKLLVSRNEVYIPAIIAKEIGYDRLKKINNRGKREVQRRQEKSQQDEKPQSRGFIQKKEGDVIRSADYSEGGIDASRAMILRLTGHLRNIEEGLGEGFKYGKKSKEGDTLRHILTSGYISEDGFFNKFMSDAFDSREMGDNMSEEDKIDLNNNKFGRLLRQKYPDRVEFTKQARKVVENLIKGKKTEIDGVSPMLSVKAE